MGMTFEWWDVAGTPAWPELQPYRTSENRQPHGIAMLIKNRSKNCIRGPKNDIEDGLWLGEGCEGFCHTDGFMSNITWSPDLDTSTGFGSDLASKDSIDLCSISGYRSKHTCGRSRYYTTILVSASTIVKQYMEFGQPRPYVVPPVFYIEQTIIITMNNS